MFFFKPKQNITLVGYIMFINQQLIQNNSYSTYSIFSHYALDRYLIIISFFNAFLISSSIYGGINFQINLLE